MRDDTSSNNNSNNDRNNQNEGRHHLRPEDNPFIAFRRFADSQVSSLLNTVFTLPATLASYNNAHQARELCLFGKADQRQCDRLHNIEAEIAELRNEGRELFRVGDVQAVLRNSEELMRLDRRADDIRRDILRVSDRENQTQPPRRNETELVERVANKKGQEWGWSWDWGFPRPFDHECQNNRHTSNDQDANNSVALDRLLPMQAEASRLAQDFEDKAWEDSAVHLVRFDNYTQTQSDGKQPRLWSWPKSWQWPPTLNSSPSDIDAYSPSALEQNPALNRAGVPWRAAYEDLLRTEEISMSQRQSAQIMEQDNETTHPSSMYTDTWSSRPKIPITHRQLEETMERNGKPVCPRLSAQAEPNYEYSHDHEDQYNDQPTTKHTQFPLHTASQQDPTNHSDREVASYEEYSKEMQDPATEMDAYERLDAAFARTVAQPEVGRNEQSEAKSSILSTLTTTERTVAPNGTITTKVLLKKRFADGREESTETVHTERGQETNDPSRDPWKALRSGQSDSLETGDSRGKKKSGWFWSG
ncbi:hypothetical protein COCMIDRAFT_36180 [Bipolaris oryzae ATCC 44560]|uniref:Uncharacterized protein n=1 Tax=Bipolaris oryzae ATCC 44560 TaxID=930090 RepID=W6Z8X6_COCMI|nr:uncharacterized protein COCMIDRAFT_36180 [Bipolaris oryzae ATCC 44560]EUC46218.1 hypothetical protein COCMIDRAFT_36180 [Bipolaris oryzae ATCC 44560]